MDSSRPPQIIFSLACVSIETRKLSPGPLNIGASGPFNSQKKFAKLCVTPNLAHKFCPIMWLVSVPYRLLA